MTRRSLILLLGLACCEARPRQQPPPEPPKPTATARASATPSPASAPAPAPDEGEAAGIHYLIRYTGGARAEETLPMVVAIHGLGDRPEGIAPVVESFQKKARFVLPRGLDPYGSGYSWFPIRVHAVDVDKVASALSHSAERVSALMEKLPNRYPTRGKPIVTGFSQGGMLSFALAVQHPSTISRALPLSGWLPKPLWPEHAPAEAPPIVALHGDADQVLPIGPTRDAVGALRRAGFDASMHEYPSVPHTLTPAMQRDLFRELATAIEPPP